MLDRTKLTIGLVVLVLAAVTGTATGATAGDAGVVYLESQGVSGEAQAAAFVGAQVGGAAAGSAFGPAGTVVGYKVGQAAGL